MYYDQSFIAIGLLNGKMESLERIDPMRLHWRPTGILLQVSQVMELRPVKIRYQSQLLMLVHL